MLFGKHPELATSRNALLEELEAHGVALEWIFSQDTVGARMERWFSSVFQAKEIETPVTPADLNGPRLHFESL